MNESTPRITTLDLSKLAPCELPEENFDVRLKGDVTVDEKTGEKIQNVQTIKIHPISGAGMIAWGANAKNDPNEVEFEARACLTALIYGADIPKEDAERLMEYDRDSALAISNAVWVATAKFRREQNAETETAEKNSPTAETNTED